MNCAYSGIDISTTDPFFFNSSKVTLKLQDESFMISLDRLQHLLSYHNFTT